MRVVLSGLILFFGISVSMAGEENSAQRLEKAQTGMPEPSWPKKPDNRMSPLSGKMKAISEISPRFYGQDRQVQAKPAVGWQKEAPEVRKADWEGAVSRGWEEARWCENRDWTGGAGKNQKFQPDRELSDAKVLTYRELEREAAPDWSSRKSLFTRPSDGSAKEYEGRLTRVRQQVWQRETSTRDLGQGRQERFSPQEVEKILYQPAEESRVDAKEQSRGASPLAPVGN